uniref:Uncharacterized protein n=1 Tax=Rhizophora mucronata TaxID=61149 RepID=A0A2P2J4X3_RHIMU
MHVKMHNLETIEFSVDLTG